MLSPAHRRSIHSSFTPLLGLEETDALMSELPASPHDEPVTKADLADFRTEVHTDLADLRTSVHTDLADLRTEVHTDLADLRTSVHTDIANLQSEVHTDIANLQSEVHTDIANLRSEVHDLFRQMAMWVAVAIVTAMIGGMSLAAGVGAAVSYALGA